MCAPDVEPPEPVDPPPAPEETATNVRTKATNPNKDANEGRNGRTGMNQLRVDLKVPGGSGSGLTGLLFPGG